RTPKQQSKTNCAASTWSLTSPLTSTRTDVTARSKSHLSRRICRCGRARGISRRSSRGAVLSSQTPISDTSDSDLRPRISVSVKLLSQNANCGLPFTFATALSLCYRPIDFQFPLQIPRTTEEPLTDSYHRPGNSSCHRC